MSYLFLLRTSEGKEKNQKGKKENFGKFPWLFTPPQLRGTFFSFVVNFIPFPSDCEVSKKVNNFFCPISRETEVATTEQRERLVEQNDFLASELDIHKMEISRQDNLIDGQKREIHDLKVKLSNALEQMEVCNIAPPGYQPPGRGVSYTHKKA